MNKEGNKMKKNFILKSALCLTLAASILTMGACKSTGDNGDTTSASGDEQAAPVYYTDVPEIGRASCRERV